MKKDIDFLRAEHVTLIAAKEEEIPSETEWAIWLINDSEHDLTTVIINSHGYGEHEGRKVVTSKLRQHIEKIEPGATVKLELIDTKLFSLTNEYWVSYYIDNKIYDKKVVFLPESIIEDNIMLIPELGLQGVRHS